MSFNYDRSINSLSTTKCSYTNRTSARKFYASDVRKDVSFSKESSDNNIYHVPTRELAIAASKLMEGAKSGLKTMRSWLSTVPAIYDRDKCSSLPNITELDSVTFVNERARELSNVLNLSNSSLDNTFMSNVIVKDNPHNIFTKKQNQGFSQMLNSSIPSLDEVYIGMDKNIGTSDCFYAKLRFSIRTEDTVKGIRIFRSTIKNPYYKRRFNPVISMRGMDKLSVNKLRYRSKGFENKNYLEKKFNENGILNAISMLNPLDSYVNLRTSFDISDKNAVYNSGISDNNTSNKTTNQFDSFINGQGLDTSISKNLNIIKNIKSQNKFLQSLDISNSFVINAVGNHKNIDKTSNIPIIVNANNAVSFEEILFTSPDKLRSTIIGNRIEYTYVDDNIDYGCGYRYYVITIDDNMLDSLRSKIVDIVVEGLRIPERPKVVNLYITDRSVTLNVTVDDELVEKFEVYRRDDNLFSNEKVTILNVSNIYGLNISKETTKQLTNGFIKIGECINSDNATFYDDTVIPGDHYSYRIYSVDIFGNKSESPYELDAFVPVSYKNTELSQPVIDVEVDAKTHFARITFRCDDVRIKRLFLRRRDLTIHQLAFTTPSQVDILNVGTKFKNVYDNSMSWTGVFENEAGNNIVFIDKTIELDHTYQYNVYGVDMYGNSTSHSVSSPTIITRRPMINSPINLVAKVMKGSNFTVEGVQLHWQEGNIDISAEDRLGNRDDLRNSSIRTLYQLERKLAGNSRWTEFPLIEDNTFIDYSTSTLSMLNSSEEFTKINKNEVKSANFRPDLIEENKEYIYRVRAVQTGSYISNFSSPVSVFTSLPILVPTDFNCKISNTSVKPFYIAINWDTSDESGTVDKWELERVVINNFAASKINVRNVDEIKGLLFKPYRKIFFESSRFASSELDEIIKNTKLVNREGSRDKIAFISFKDDLFIGKHYFQDSNVRLGNTYFYRIRAVGLNDSVSNWSYYGVRLSNESFERVLRTSLSVDDKNYLTNNNVSLSLIKDLDEKIVNSFDLQPQFSRPTSMESVKTVNNEPLKDIEQLTIYNIAAFTQESTKVDKI